ncbi:MAG: SDR family NAD(P)-dependent oxidoreductase [Myxococcota bacterium]
MFRRKPAIIGLYCSELGHVISGEDYYAGAEDTIFDSIDDDAKEMYAKLLLRNPTRTRRMIRTYREIHSTADDGVKRQQEFERVALELLVDAARGVLDRTGLEPRDIDIIVCNYMAGQTLPSLTARVAGELELRDDVYTVNMGDMGCSAGVAALDVATRLLRSERKPRRALVLSTEPVSNLFRVTSNIGGVVGNTLFGEGSSGVIVSTFREPALYTIDAQQRVHRADTESLEAIKTLWGGGGPLIQLSKEIPSVAGKAIEANLRRLVPQFLSVWDKVKYVVTRRIPRWQKRISRWAIHPGGMSVLRGLESQLRLAEADLGPSYRVFQERSNMSSPSVMYALDNIEKQKPKAGERVLMMSFGSGFKVNSMILRKAKRYIYERAERFAVVAGGTSGIGLDTAKDLVARGYHVIIGSRRVADGAGFERIPGATYLPLDLCDRESIDAFVQDVWRMSYGVDVLVVSSGVAPKPALQGKQDADDIVKAVNTNLTGSMVLVNAMMPKLRVRGRVVLLNSILGQIPLMGNAAYCATKAGLRHFGEALRVECKRAGRGVRVHSIYPAYVKTPMLDSIQGEGRTFLKPVEAQLVTSRIARIIEGRSAEPSGFLLLRDKVIAGFYRYLPGVFRRVIATM